MSPQKTFVSPAYEPVNPNYTNNFPARYARLQIWFDGKGHTIYLRQGEGDDYTPGKNAGTRWSPYNLGNYNNVNEYNNNGFVDFPSKAGYFYQWGNSIVNIAPIPYTPINPMVPSSWSNTSVDALYNLGNVCPTTTTYKLPTIPDPHAPILDYSSVVWGYYADGFFDRRALNPVAYSTPGLAKTSVSYTNNNVANIGRLYYNTSSGASLFFPAGGYRNSLSGALGSTGSLGFYWTETPVPLGDAWILANSSGNAEYQHGTRSQGFSVRCVRTSLIVSPASLWLSPPIANASKTIQITSDGPWAVVAPPANASLSVSSGSGNATVTLTRSNSVFGLSSFDVLNTLTGEKVTVTVDNFFIDDFDEFVIPNSAPTGNVGEYDVDVRGGSATFTIVPGSYPSWITSATILPNGKLRLVANQSPGGDPRYGTITLAHANDPTYQVVFDVIQDFDAIPPFRYFVINLNWSLNDIDIAVEFTGNGLPVTGGGVTYNFDTGVYLPGGMTSTYADNRAVGWSLKSRVEVGGATSPFGTLPTAAQVADNVSLMMWGGDATAGQGETVFFKAPIITPADPRNDNSNLPRYVSLNVYAWWHTTTVTPGSPIKVTVSTYDDAYEYPVGSGTMVPSIMLRPTSTNTTTGINQYNFYCVRQGTTAAQLQSNTGPTFLNPPLWNTVSERRIYRVRSGSLSFNNYRVNHEHVCTITYDRYKRTASINWIAAPFP